MLRGQLVGGALRLAVGKTGDHAQIVERLVSLGLQLVLGVVGVHLRGGGFLVHQGTLQGGLKALVVGLCGLERQLGTQQLLLKLRIGQVKKDGIRSDIGAGQDAYANHGGVGLRGNQLDRVLPGNQASGRGPHLADQRTPLDHVRPDSGAIDRGCGGLEPRDRQTQQCQNHHRDASPYDQLALLLLHQVRACDIHRPGESTWYTTEARPMGVENKQLGDRRWRHNGQECDRFQLPTVRFRTVASVAGLQSALSGRL